MAEIHITCPNCGKQFTLSEVLTQQLEEEIRDRLLTETQEQYEKKLFEETAKFQEKMRMEMERIKSEFEDKHSLEINDLREQVKEKVEMLDKMCQQELELRKQQRELEYRQKTMELEIIKKVDEEAKKQEQKITERVTEEYRMKELEKDKQLSGLKQEINLLKQKAEQGSQQIQGEVAELELENLLKVNFPDDQIEPVAKGIKGADVVQKVFTKSGAYCGTIIWESKNARRWSDNWLTKLRDDLRTIKADLAILATRTMPQGIVHFDQKDEIWVTEFLYAIGLASVLRIGLIEVANAKLASVGKDIKIENLYAYLSGIEFKQRVEAIVESISTLRNNLEDERRAMEGVWAEREKHIYKAVQGIAGMYGDMKGIIGHALPRIERLELQAQTVTVVEVQNEEKI